jgi:hypothetical protein
MNSYSQKKGDAHLVITSFALMILGARLADIGQLCHFTHVDLTSPETHTSP